MDPLELLKPSMPAPRKLLAESFNEDYLYQKWLEKNPYIEPISIIEFRGKILITYKEPF